MTPEDSVPIYVPREHLSDLSEIIRVGLEEANLPRESRKNLQTWWEAERDFIYDKLEE